MKFLVKPFNKAIRLYKNKSIIQFQDDNTLKITKIPTCNNLELQTNKILNYINGRINNEDRINSIKNLLQLVKLYQDLTIGEIVKYQQTRIGGYSDLLQSVITPSGTTTETKIEKIEPKKSNEEINSELKNFLKDNIIKIEPIALKIDSFKFNNLNDMIYLKIKKTSDGRMIAEVIDIFEKQEQTQTQTQEQTQN